MFLDRSLKTEDGRRIFDLRFEIWGMSHKFLILVFSRGRALRLMVTKDIRDFSDLYLKQVKNIYSDAGHTLTARNYVWGALRD